MQGLWVYYHNVGALSVKFWIVGRFTKMLGFSFVKNYRPWVNLKLMARAGGSVGGQQDRAGKHLPRSFAITPASIAPLFLLTGSQ